MSNKQKNKKLSTNAVAVKQEAEISEQVERGFSLLLKIMSWIIGISALAVVILPNFDLPYVAILVKIIFLLGVFNLLLFALLELFGTAFKKTLSKLN